MRPSLLTLPILCLSCFAASQPVDIAKGLVLENRFVRLEFEPSTMGLAVMLDRQTGINHIAATAKQRLLWEVTFAKGTQRETVTNRTKPCTHAWVETLAGGARRAVLEWNDQRFWLENGALTVHAEVELPADSGIALWRVHVENHSDYWSLWNVAYPLVSGFPEAGKYDLARPVFATGGHLLKAWNSKLRARYPSGGWPMQFLSLARGEGSVYLGTRDPDARAKDFLLDATGEGRAGIAHYVENMGVAGSGYPDYYPVEFGVHAGNWVHAAQHYRTWALQQKWASAGPVSHRAGLPDAIKNAAAWFRDDWQWRGASGTPHEQNVPLLEAAEWMGVPTALHWYNWHHMPFDNEYPHFLPAKDGFRERVRELTAKGLLIMPYINGSSADINISDWGHFAPHAIADEGGGQRMHFYSDAAGRLTTMCPSSQMWRETIAGVAGKLVEQESVNGVYVDQISAMEHELCFAPQHHHPLGGGHYWTDGYRDELRMIRNAAQRKQLNAVITSEGANEVFFDLVDANLTWWEVTNNEIPLMETVYAGYTLFFGSPVNYRASDNLFRYGMGQAFIDGRQNGWVDLKIMEPEFRVKAEYFRTCARYHAAARDFLTFGRLWGPIEPARPVATFHDADLKPRAETASAEARLWQAEDGRLAVVLANYTGSPVEFAWTLKPEQYGVRGPHSQLLELTPAGTTPLGPAPDEIARTEMLAPATLKVIVISAR